MRRGNFARCLSGGQRFIAGIVLRWSPFCWHRSTTASRASLSPSLPLRFSLLKASQPEWRSDWEPVWILLLLISIFMSTPGFFCFIVPPSEHLHKYPPAFSF